MIRNLIISLAVLTSLAIPKSSIAQNTSRQFTTDQAFSTTNITGTAGNRVHTIQPGNNYMLFRLEFAERGDNPCHLQTYWWRTNPNTGNIQTRMEEWPYCGNRGHTNRSRRSIGVPFYYTGPAGSALEIPASLDVPMYAVYGMRVCDNDRNPPNRKLKGARVLGSTVDRDGNGLVQRDASLAATPNVVFSRTNCREWRQAQRCDSGQVVVGLDVFSNLLSSQISITGFRLRCAGVTVSGSYND